MLSRLVRSGSFLKGLRCGYATKASDVVIVGAGHNGLVATILLARQGLKVRVLEEKDEVGGACKTEFPFKKAIGLGSSTGAYLLGVMPPELLKVLNVNLPLLRRDPWYFLPTTGKKHLLFSSDAAQLRKQFGKFFSEDDWEADKRLQVEISQLREDIAPAWMKPPLSVEATAERYVRPQLRQIFIDLCKQPVAAYLERFGFKSELLKAMYAVTDGVLGLSATWDMEGSGLNFLCHNMCRLPGAEGTWMVVEGGMGMVTGQLHEKALREGAIVDTNCLVESVMVGSDGAARGVRLANGREVEAKVVIGNMDPFQLRELVGAERFGPELNKRLDAMRRNGNTLKVNMALKKLPRFTCLPQEVGQHRTTTHLLPEGEDVLGALAAGYADAQAGRLPEFPAIEWYFHTTLDGLLFDHERHHSSALFVQWVPHTLATSTWEEQEERYVRHLLSICDRFAPGTSDLVADVFTLTPPKIESHFGITGGHIHHIDNTFGFDQRFPYATPVPGLYSASAGCFPAGSVVGCAGHNAAAQVVRDLGLAPCWPTA